MKRFNYFDLSIIIMIILISFSFETQAQNFSTQKLDLMFYDYKVVNIDSKKIHNTSRNNHFFEIDIPKQQGNEFWRVELHDSGLISEDYVSQYTSETGVKVGKRTTAIPTKGHIVGDLNTTVSLTFNEGFIYGFIQDKTGYNYIEPLSYFDKTQRGSDQYVVYNAKDLKPTAPHSCGNTEMHDKTKELISQTPEIDGTRLDECFEVDYAIANDFLMFQDFGSVFATEDHAIGVTNNVQTNYDNEFADELQYIIVTQFTVSTSAADDPWYTGVNGSTLLSSFRTWGNGGGFGSVVYDVASLWTSRDFYAIVNGQQAFGVIGIASVGVICNNGRYNILENYTSDPQSKRVLVAHELGHNWSSGHDNSGSATIMAPSVVITNSWSAQSISSINNHIASRDCLANCSGTAGPNASFDFDIIEDCTPGLVQFTNTSGGGGTLSYQWEFQGGTPSFSIDENPLVTYNTAGTFNVTLTVSNTTGSDVNVQNGIIDIKASPEPNFGFGLNGTIVSFFNFSENATSYVWDFGDGTFSANSDPVHDYLNDGVYTVSLTASSICGEVTIEKIIVVANPPTANFEADAVEGCAELTVQYFSTSSSNTDSFIWNFEGGDPASSTEENPTVTYSVAGVYDASLTVMNETGEDVKVITDFITVNDVPDSDFTLDVNDNEVTFTNLSVGADSYIWDFGDGNSSTEENPVHTYSGDGEFIVTLTAINDCGENASTNSATLSLEPVASFETVQLPSDCATFTLDFTSTSTNDPDTYNWVFEGGSPATSSLANPSITYSVAGDFDVSLTVTNVHGTHTLTLTDFVTVNDDPISSFTYTENGLMVSFLDGSADSDSHTWDFGDGNTSTEASPVHEYAVEGIYTVELLVSNECGTNTSTQIINNYTPVTANLSSNITSGCANLEIEYGDESSANVTSWMWTFEGGTPSTSTEENPVVTYTSAGQYDVNLTVSHPESTNTITLVNYIAVSDIPITSFEYFDNIYDVDFTNTSVEGMTFMWDFGDGNSSVEESPSHTYSAEGVYEVILTATNDCGTITSMQSVSINALPTAGINSEASSGCGPLTVQFNDASSSNVTGWAWKFPGGDPATSNLENPIVVYSAAGTYEVELVVTAPAGMDMIVMNDFIEVFGAPTAEIDYELDGNAITATNIGLAGSTTSWTVDGIEEGDAQLEYVFPENGTYTIELTTENTCGTDTESVEVEVDVYPVASIDGFPVEVCVGEELQLVDNSSNAENKFWTTFGANPGSSEESNPVVTYENEGVYSISLMVSNQYGESTKNFIDVVNVIGLPTATFVGVQNDNVVNFSPTASGATAYFWEFGDGNTSTEENPSHTYTKNGMFEVKLTVTNKCGEYFVIETYTVISNSVTESELEDVNIFPNPARSNLNIKLTNSESDLIKMDLLDITGKLIMSNSFKTSNYSMDVSSISAGTYLIRLSSEDATYFKKIVILR